MSKWRDWVSWMFQVIIIILVAIAIALIRGKPVEIPPLPPPPLQERPPDVVTPPPLPPGPLPDTRNAICKIRTTVGGCSATVIGPRRQDGRYWVLSAAHCISTLGEHVDMMFRDGKTTGAKVVNYDKRADWSWLITDTNTEQLPFALLAEKTPEVGEEIWHSGFGVDKPGNLERGEVLSREQPNGRVRLRLSVSSGDSGGGFVVNKDGKVFSTCCCTVWDGRSRWTEGPSTERIRSGLTEKIDLWEFPPVPLPHYPAENVPKEMPKK